MTKTFKQLKTEEIRETSGIITSEDPIVELLYEIIRDHVPCGVIEAAVQTIEQHRENDDKLVIFSNGWLADYAINLAERLKK